MSPSENEFRRALEAEAGRAHPSADALEMLYARSRRRRRARGVGVAFAGVAAATAVLVGALVLRPSPDVIDVEFAGPPAPGARATPIVSEEADGGSILAEVSGDGRFVVFMSDASNLVDGDTNGASDTFVRDLSTGGIERVSISSDGEQGDADSLSASISGDGRFVAFRSRATNLVAADRNRATDIFVRDRSAGTTARVSIASDGSEANRDSDSASISADGRFVAFRSLATDLVEGDTNAVADVFVHDRETGRTERLSVASDGTQTDHDSRNPQISADGTHVAFASYARTLVTGDTNRTWDVFVHDRASGSTRRVSVSSDGAQANGPSTFPSLSADGAVVAFVSEATSLIPGDTNGVRDAFVRDDVRGTTERVSIPSGGGQARGATFFAALSPDAGFVAISSEAPNLVPGDDNRRRDIFLVDRSSGQVALVSVASDERAGDGDSGGPSVSADGRFVAFQSSAASLSAGDTNGVRDVFVRDVANRTTARVSTARR